MKNILTGNHEIFYGEGRNRERNYELFEKYFPISFSQSCSCFVDNYPGSEDNACFIFDKSNILLLCLEFAPRDGNQVHQILTNYLDDNVHDDGWIRIINFYPKKGKAEIFTYSPIKNEFLTDPDNQFELIYK